VNDIYQESLKLFTNFDYNDKPIRLIGVKVSHFTEAPIQHQLFNDRPLSKNEGIHIAIDKIKERYGFDAIQHGSKRLNDNDL